LADKFATPLESFLREMQKLDEWKDRANEDGDPNFSDELYQRAVKDARKAAISGIIGNKGQIETTAAMTRGSQAAYSAIVRARLGGQKSAEVAKLEEILTEAQASVEAEENAEDILKEIRDELKGVGIGA
jgi:hypothetical protein